jgi:hypothetical protein
MFSEREPPIFLKKESKRYSYQRDYEWFRNILGPDRNEINEAKSKIPPRRRSLLSQKVATQQLVFVTQLTGTSSISKTPQTAIGKIRRQVSKFNLKDTFKQHKIPLQPLPADCLEQLGKKPFYAAQKLAHLISHGKVSPEVNLQQLTRDQQFLI